ncbi:hypothetical protein [Marinimicrobium alkaliphilum]|nr:hypothetical protein [Marinimicrobium alkaliphilum]
MYTAQENPAALDIIGALSGEELLGNGFQVGGSSGYLSGNGLIPLLSA